MKKMGNVISEKVYREKKLKDGKVGESLRTRAVIVQIFEPRYFEVCPNCGKRAIDGKCAEHGSVKPSKRALINLVLDDGSETMRCVLFGEHINKLGLSDEEIFSLDKFTEKKQGFLGEEKIFSGNLRSNNLYNTTELTIEDVQEIKVEELVKELEAK